MSLQHNARNTVLISQTKHTWSAINNVFKLVQLDYGTPGENTEIFSTTKSKQDLNKEFSKYFRNSIYCKSYSYASECSFLKNYKIYYSSPVYDSDNTSASMVSMSSTPLIILSSGAVVSLTTIQNNCDDYAATGVSRNSDGTIKTDSNGNAVYWSSTRSNCGTLLFDVNGKKGPNRMGVDAFRVNIFRSYLGADYWSSATGNTTLFNILKGSEYPFSYKAYDDLE